MKIRYKDAIQMGYIGERELFYDERREVFYLSCYKSGEDSNRQIHFLLSSASPVVVTLLLRTIDKGHLNDSFVMLILAYIVSYLVFRFSTRDFFQNPFEVSRYHFEVDELTQYLKSLSQKTYVQLGLHFLFIIGLCLCHYLYLNRGESVLLVVVMLLNYVNLLLMQTRPIKRFNLLKKLLRINNR